MDAKFHNNSIKHWNKMVVIVTFCGVRHSLQHYNDTRVLPTVMKGGKFNEWNKTIITYEWSKTIIKYELIKQSLYMN